MLHHTLPPIFIFEDLLIKNRLPLIRGIRDSMKKKYHSMTNLICVYLLKSEIKSHRVSNGFASFAPLRVLFIYICRRTKYICRRTKKRRAHEGRAYYEKK